MKRIAVSLTKRNIGKKSQLKQARKQGYVPVEIYGKGVENIHAFIPLKDLLALPHGETFLLEVDIEGQKRICLVKDIETGWLGDNPVHVDLYDISQVESIEIEVPIEFVGTPEGVSMGGTFEVLLHTLTVKASVENIPDKIIVDVSSLGLGSVLHVRDVLPPKGCIIIDSPEEVVAVVSEPEAEGTTAEETTTQ